mgnify:CR=1 FL=1
MSDKKLTKEEARKFAELLNKLDNEMNTRLEKGDYDGKLYTTIIRGKYKRYIEQVYNIDL